MGTQKSHFAYRLAWENTSSERIPFLPLHRRDLVSAEEGNKTFVGGAGRLINWKKFEVMGEVIVGIQKSQATPYPNVARNEEIQRLILEGRFCKDDDVSLLKVIPTFCSHPSWRLPASPLLLSLVLVHSSPSFKHRQSTPPLPTFSPFNTAASCIQQANARFSSPPGTLRQEYTARAGRNRRKRQEKVQLVPALVQTSALCDLERRTT